MKKVNGEIIEATEKELRDLWINSGWNSYSWDSFLRLMKQRGCKITMTEVEPDKFDYEKQAKEQEARDKAIQNKILAEIDKCNKEITKCESQINGSAPDVLNGLSEQETETQASATVEQLQMDLEAASEESVKPPANDSAIIVPTLTNVSSEMKTELGETSQIKSETISDLSLNVSNVKENSGKETTGNLANVEQTIEDILATPEERQVPILKTITTSINPELVKEVIKMKEKDETQQQKMKPTTAPRSKGVGFSIPVKKKE